jgi:nicotinate-nucleotide adenylyltransferase
MRIGVFGGTFDPVHVGHLVMAEQCREQAKLDRVLFVPAARPPHKQERIISDFTHRAEMLRLALAGQPAFQVDELERDRPGPSFTVETLQELLAHNPGEQFELLLGADCLPDLPTWKDPARIVQLAGLVVVNRPGFALMTPEMLRASLGLAPESVARFQAVDSPLLEISSRDLRRRVAAGLSIRYLVPRAVECYIEAHRLYRE